MTFIGAFLTILFIAIVAGYGIAIGAVWYFSASPSRIWLGERISRLDWRLLLLGALGLCFLASVVVIVSEWRASG